tara:strand:- start:5894 stop:7297 length:1404 start_codon:yes stop_codon:yes gene_type:complete
MKNELYETNYTNIIEPKYGNKRNILLDEKLEKEINSNHDYSIQKREDLTHLETYSIDPEGCKDADDAFSIFEKNNKLFLAIHIADPTEHIPLHSNIWKDILSRGTTKYPSNRQPIHMMPEKILVLSSLQGSITGCIKKAITVMTEIDKKTYYPINEIKLLFSEITVKEKNAYSYNEAALCKNVIKPLINGLAISESLKKKRSFLTKGVKLNDLNTAYIIYDYDKLYLHEDSKEEKEVKQMIAEFAIFANSFIGEYLKINLNIGIFRTCNAKSWLNTVYNEMSGEKLLQEIITNGIRADYMSNVSSHDLVGMPEYCHFTSPIRRVSDCVCHYLIKYIYLKNKKQIELPFTDYELENIANKCLSISKNEKKNQYVDIKFRLLQVMFNMLLTNNNLELGYYITSYSGLFLNIIISKINNFSVHMSYTIRTRNFDKTIDPKYMYFVSITRVNCFTQYDEGTLPELDYQVLN